MPAPPPRDLRGRDGEADRDASGCVCVCERIGPGAAVHSVVAGQALDHVGAAVARQGVRCSPEPVRFSKLEMVSVPASARDLRGS